MSLQEAYADVLEVANKVGIKLGELKEEGGKLVLRGTTEFAMHRDQLWDKIKTHGNWANEIVVMLDVTRNDTYGIWKVKAGETLSKISKEVYGDFKHYTHIFAANKDKLESADKIKVGQELSLPDKAKVIG